MLLIYRLIVSVYGLLIRLISPWNKKAAMWVSGRKDWRNKLRGACENLRHKPIWLHASSVGEFEQGRPIIENLKKFYPDIPVIVTFFSPSGHEQFRNFSLAESVQYLPLDSPENARDFISIVNPKFAVFVKYEFWYFYFKELTNQSIPFVLISAKLTRKHLFFKWYGQWYQKVLRYPTYYFVQDRSTEKLLSEIGITNVSVSGDTRIDRVVQLSGDAPNDLIHEFKNKELLVLGGSVWKTESQFLEKWYGSEGSKPKLLIAPHEIREERIVELEKKYGKDSIRYTQISDSDDLAKKRVLILDTIGLLSRAYRYADVAVIGGGFRDGIHNILEPAVFGVPSLFGPNHHKFHEAKDLIDRGAAMEFEDYNGFVGGIQSWLQDDEHRRDSSQQCKRYIEDNTGATEKIMKRINEWLVD